MSLKKSRSLRDFFSASIPHLLKITMHKINEIGYFIINPQMNSKCFVQNLHQKIFLSF